jgi:hypothetical protein
LAKQDAIDEVHEEVSSLGGRTVEGTNKPQWATVGITKPVKGNGKVMSRENKNRWTKAKQASRPLICQEEPAAGATKDMKPKDHRKRTDW